MTALAGFHQPVRAPCPLGESRERAREKPEIAGQTGRGAGGLHPEGTPPAGGWRADLGQPFRKLAQNPPAPKIASHRVQINSAIPILRIGWTSGRKIVAANEPVYTAVAQDAKREILENCHPHIRVPSELSMPAHYV